MTINSVSSGSQLGVSVTAVAKQAPASGAAVVTSIPNPIPSLNPPGSADCGAALDDKAAPLFSLDDNSSSCGGLSAKPSVRQESGADRLGPQDLIHEGIPKILQRDSNNEPMARGG